RRRVKLFRRVPLDDKAHARANNVDCDGATAACGGARVVFAASAWPEADRAAHIAAVEQWQCARSSAKRKPNHAAQWRIVAARYAFGPARPVSGRAQRDKLLRSPRAAAQGPSEAR